MIKDDTVFLRHILDAINKIQEYIKGMNYEGFKASSLVQDGVIRQLEIIGEAANSVSPAFRDRFLDIPWGKMTGLRNRLIHGYFDVDLDIVWSIVQDDLPVLTKQLCDILEHDG